MCEEQVQGFKESNNVAQRNDFIRQTNGSIDMVPLKLFKLLISCIDTTDPPKEFSIYIKKGHILKFMGVSRKSAYSYLKNQLDKLVVPVTLRDSDGYLTKVALMTKYSWTPKSDLVKCTFDEEVWPYLTNLSKMYPYLQYNIMQIQNFRSKFSIILYENLLSYTRETGNKIIEIDMKTLRYITGTENKYRNFKDFESNVLKPAQKEMNEAESLEFFFTYEKIKHWKEVASVKFLLRKRTSFLDTLDHTEYPERLAEKI